MTRPPTAHPLLASTKETALRGRVVPLQWVVQVAPPSVVRTMVPPSPTATRVPGSKVATDRRRLPVGSGFWKNQPGGLHSAPSAAELRWRATSNDSADGSAPPQPIAPAIPATLINAARSRKFTDMVDPSTLGPPSSACVCQITL